MASNSSIIDSEDPPTGVLDVEGYAIYPDCGTKPTPVPSTVTLAQLLPVVASSGSQQAHIPTESEDLPVLDPWGKEAAIVSELRDLIAKLPPTVLEAGPADVLAIFGKDPKSFDDLEMPLEDIWETMMNPTLKSILGWGNNVDLATVIRRGALGMDGFLHFINYFVDIRKVPEFLLEGKLTRLMEALRIL
ncbi:hypothetical protein DXG01_013604 [Tephrocybe rancida]|nr:hypothetical protein DXG01_013604 [Tephrocybe rancida]